MSCSSVVEVQASPNANQLQQTETMICMHLDVYNAAAKGEIQFFIWIRDSLDLLLTPNKNTILHVYITSLDNMKPRSEPGSKTRFVKAILDICPPLVRQCNTKGETPLHIAARYGHATIVGVLIDQVKTEHKALEGQSQVGPSKEMLRMVNKWKDTALHEAVRHNHLEVVKLLLGEDPDFEYSANEAGETLLYMAVEKGFREVAFEILKTCNSIAYTGPLGRTALHAATLQDDSEMIKKIIEKDGGLTKQADQMGFTPLHLAAGFKCWFVTNELLKHDREVAYMKDTEGRTALHIAAYEGNYFIVKEIVSSCPDCCELVDNRGWNVLHFSVASQSIWTTEQVNHLLENPSLKNLLNEKDLEGNTPFLLHCKTDSPMSLEKLINHSSVDKMVFNNQNLSASEIAMTNENLPEEKRALIEDATHGLFRRQVSFHGGPKLSHEEQKLEEKRKAERKSHITRYEKMGEYHLIVAALITTVTFAAGITMPGGFMGQDGPHPGSAILARSAAFKAFLITDTISMLLSIVAILALMLLPTESDNESTSAANYLETLICLGFFSIVVALGAMILAFVTGTYAVLEHHSKGLAVAVCLIGLSFFPILFLVYRRALKVDLD